MDNVLINHSKNGTITDGLPLISVIVPVYNTDKYLTRCIKSLLRQTYPNLEIVIINDGSEDNSGEICNMFSDKYTNIRVYHQENKGQAIARNYGLDKCQGEYVGFVDSDDYIACDMYEYLYGLIIDNAADCASISFTFTTSDFPKKIKQKETINVWSGQEILEKHLLEAMATGSHSVCRCLFKRSVLSKVRFPNGIINEDIPFKFAALSNVKRMVNSNLIKYYYYQKGMSTTRGAFKEKDLNLFKATELMQSLASPYNERIRELAKAKHERGYFSILARIAFYGSAESKERTEEIIGICQRQLRDNWRFLCSMPLPLSRKMLILLFACNFQLAELCIRLAKIILGQRK
ncbi:glycosyltransferase [Selenomonas sp. AE3005]|uniref:glycosyltransferase family 2 protein n=1 Tax=Selenomonas sp. AE3005 TaxID=1485543 RepID=UPI00048360AF|nr:glycosyltransferase [Selenomonas sp. AE3005]